MIVKQAPPVSFRPGPLAARLDARGANRNEVASRDLGRYYHLIERTLATVQMSSAEWNLIRDALNGTIVESWWSGHTLASSISAASDDGLADKWHVDSAALVERLIALSPAQTIAVCDAVEQWWRRQR